MSKYIGFELTTFRYPGRCSTSTPSGLLIFRGILAKDGEVRHSQGLLRRRSLFGPPHSCALFPLQSIQHTGFLSQRFSCGAVSRVSAWISEGRGFYSWQCCGSGFIQSGSGSSILAQSGSGSGFGSGSRYFQNEKIKKL